MDFSGLYSGYHLGFSFSLAIVIFVLARVALIYQKQRDFIKKNGCHPITNKHVPSHFSFGLDTLGYFYHAENNRCILDMLRRFILSRGSTVKVCFALNPVIVTTEKENFKAVLNDRFDDYDVSERLRYFGPFMGRGVFTSDGEEWKFSRNLLKPNFDRKQLADLDMIEEHVQKLMRLIPGNGETVELQELFLCFTLDSATEFLFGVSADSLGYKCGAKLYQNKEFADAIEYSQKNCVRRFKAFSFYWAVIDPKADESNKICHKYIDTWIDRAIRDKKAKDCRDDASTGQARPCKYVFLGELMKKTTDRERLRGELLNVLIAGRDSTASLLANLIFVLSRRPDIWHKLQQEVDTLQGDKPSFAQLKNMSYLRYCIQESLRIHPIVPMNIRTASRDSVLPLGGGKDGQSPIHVPKGTRVLLCTQSMHRRYDYFGKDAEEFRPERWQYCRPGWAFMAFNGGPRTCIGQQYAQTEASYVMVRFMQKYRRIESRDDSPWTEDYMMTCRSLNGTKVGLWSREKLDELASEASEASKRGVEDSA